MGVSPKYRSNASRLEVKTLWARPTGAAFRAASASSSLSKDSRCTSGPKSSMSV